MKDWLGFVLILVAIVIALPPLAWALLWWVFSVFRFLGDI